MRRGVFIIAGVVLLLLGPTLIQVFKDRHTTTSQRPSSSAVATAPKAHAWIDDIGTDSKASREQLENEARLGNSFACHELANRLRTENTDAAIAWYRKGVELHNPFCMFELAILIESKIDEAIALHRQAIAGLEEYGFAQPATMSKRRLGALLFRKGGIYEQEGYAWTKKAAEEGDPCAQCNLGCYYLNGTYKDARQSVLWLRKAVAQDFHLALIPLGKCYGLGMGVAEDRVKEYACFNLALQHGNSDVVEVLDNLKVLLTPRELKSASAMTKDDL